MTQTPKKPLRSALKPLKGHLKSTSNNLMVGLLRNNGLYYVKRFLALVSPYHYHRVAPELRVSVASNLERNRQELVVLQRRLVDVRSRLYALNTFHAPSTPSAIPNQPFEGRPDSVFALIKFISPFKSAEHGDEQ